MFVVNLIEAIIQTGSNEAIAAKIKEYESQISMTETFIKSFEQQNIKQTISEDQVREKINELREYMKNPDNIVRTKYILNQYIERVDLSANEAKVTFKVAFAFNNELVSVCCHYSNYPQK